MTVTEATRIITDLQGRLQREVGEYRLTVQPAGETLSVAQLRFRVGSQPGNDLVLAHESVSRYHLEIVAEAAGYLVRDLDTTNGTWVGELRIKQAYLPRRARLRLGQLALDFELGDGRRAVPAAAGDAFHGLVGASALMREVFAQLERVAPTDATVLIEGESGTGKELVARAVHRASPRRQGPLVVFDCAAVPRSLIEAELFGHERGAFTGADRARPGCFEEADGGTLFLDELGELPLELQPRLLRVLEGRQVRRIGARQPRAVDLRLVAATNRDLAREVNRGTFRADLYYRVAVVSIRVPALRERREDIAPLLRHFVGELLRDDPGRAAEVIGGISDDNWRRLESLPWPGNVRELRNFIERTLALSHDGPHTADIRAAAPGGPGPGATGVGAGGATPGGVDLDQPFTDHKAAVIADFERAYLLGQLARHEHNISAAARAAGLDRMNFKRLLKKHRDG